MRLKRDSIRALATAGVLLGASGMGWSEYYQRSGMPDFDQKRSGLPNTGNYYCVPTSYVDMYMYMASHGMPGMDGGYSSSYSDITAFILFTGILMGTDPNKGTHGAYGPGKSWINSHTSHAVYHWFYGPDWDWGTATLKNALKTGSLCAIGRGKYQWDGNDYDRVGGHEVVLVGFDYNSNGKSLIVRDPNDDSNLNSQSSYLSVYKDTTNYSIDTEAYGVVTHARYTNSTGGGNNRYIVDSLHQVMPMFAGWTYGTSAGTNFKVYWPFMWEEATHGGPQELNFTSPNVVTDWCFDIGEVAIFYLTPGGDIRRIDMDEQTDTLVRNLPGASKIVVGGPKCDIFVLKKTLLSAGDTLYKVTRSTSALESKISLPKHVMDIDWDVQGNGMAMISNDLETVYRCNSNLQGLQIDNVRTLYSNHAHSFVPVTDFSVSHDTGEIILGALGTNTYQKYRRVLNTWSGKSYAYRGSTGIQTIVAAEGGQTFIQDGSSLVTLDVNGNYITNDFTGLGVQNKFQLSRSYVATQPGSMDGPGWDDVLPDE